MLSNEIRQRYLKFFEKRGHTIIPSASLIPENDPSSLFTTAGMQPLVPYLLGAKHPAGTRLVDVQKCVRTGDIEEVGDNRHLTFFEMMGNWSLGDYFKKESIEWSLEFLTDKNEGLGLDVNRLYVTVFKGEPSTDSGQENGIPRDEDAIKYWKENFKKHGIDAEVSSDETIKDNIRIIPLGKEDNFWIAGQTGPCGGDTEIFYDVVGNGSVEGNFQDLVKAGRIIEIWNNVFMEFNKTSDGKYEKLPKPNVDTGMGLERTSVVMQGKSTVFDTDIFSELLSYIKSNSTNYEDKTARIVADHIRASVFIISDGVVPSKSEAGYVLRKLLRRASDSINKLNLNLRLISHLVDIVIDANKNNYRNLFDKRSIIVQEIERELEKKHNIDLGVDKILEDKFDEFMQSEHRTPMRVRDHIPGKAVIPAQPFIPGSLAFKLYSTFAVPKDKIIQFAESKGYVLDLQGFEEEFNRHKELSRAGSEQKFKGGLAGTGEQETKYHTATHLLLGALRKVLNAEIVQKGSNITADRMRFDFNWPEKVSAEKLKEVENLINQKIAEKIPVEMLELPKEDAQKICTVLSFDLSKYSDVVKVYKISDFDVEFCGGPHVKNTGELGHFKIIKEEASSAGVRRIKAILE
jgi:alanyl-tRNA synthetase